MTKPAPGPDQPPIPVRLVTFNTHHGVGRRRPARPAPAGPGCSPRPTPTSSACRRSTGTSASAARTSTRRCCSPGRWTCSWPGGPAIDEPRPGGRPRAVSTATRCCPGCRSWSATCTGCPAAGEPRSALRTMLELDGGTLWVTTTHLSTGHPERAGRAGRPRWPRCTPSSMEAGVAGRRLQRRPRRPRAGARCAARFADAWELADERDDRAGWRFWQHDEGLTHPARSPHRRIDQVWVTPGVAVAGGAGARRATAPRTTCRCVVDLAVPAGV